MVETNLPHNFPLPCPDKEFVLSGPTFAQVYEMAGWLQEFYARENSRNQAVCLAADNKALIAAALLASMAKGPLLLLPYAFSRQILAEMHEVHGYTLAISDNKRDFPSTTRVICPVPGKHQARFKLDKLNPDAPLLRLFTGGSTGTPRSWLKTADNLFGEAFYLAKKYKINQNDLLVASVSPYHIYGLLFSVIIPFISSATVRGDTPCFPAEIREAARDRATILAAVPAHYRALKGSKTRGKALRLAFSSAGMLAQADNEDFCQQNNIPIVEVYGSTETGGIAARNRSHGESCFYPFAPVEWQLSRENLKLKSPYISPGAELDEMGFFTMGDRIEPGPENGFFMKGRADAITKVGGKRVDLEEVRDRIKSQPGVMDCVVVSLANPGGRENMIAALVQGKDFKIKELRKNIGLLLEPYALPRLIRSTDDIPLTANGKYDLAAIRRFFK